MIDELLQRLLNLLSRKFLLSLVGLVGILIALLEHVITFDQFLVPFTAILGLYGVANVAQKFKKSDDVIS